MASFLTTILFTALVFATPQALADCPLPKCFSGRVKVIVPFPPGGPVDRVARVWSEQLGKQLGQPVVVENKAGVGGTVGANEVAKSAPDSQTILVTSQAPIVIAPHIYQRLPFDPAKDLIPAAQIGTLPHALVIRGDLPYKSTQEFIRGTRQKQAKYATSGNGTLSHLQGEFFTRSTQAGLTHIPYRGSAPALTDLVGGQVEAMFTDLPSVMDHVRSGKLRILAVTGEQRSRLAPEVPTFAEQGVPALPSGWFGAFFPAATHPEIISRLNTENRKVLADPDVQKRLADIGVVGSSANADAFAGMVRAESTRWGQVVRESKVRAE